MTLERKASLIFLVAMLLVCISVIVKGSSIYDFWLIASRNVFNGIDPYPPEWRSNPNFLEIYTYGPIFTVYLHILSLLSPGRLAATFILLLLNLFAFWHGFKGALRHLDPGHNLLKGWWFVLAVFLMANEVSSNLLVLQTNLFITGISLMAVAAYIERKFAWSAFLLAFGIYIKVFPVVFALLLALDLNRKFLGYFALFNIGMLLFPLLFITPDFYLYIFKHWYYLHSTEVSRPHFFDLGGTLLYLGYNFHPFVLSLFMNANAALVALVAYFTLRHKKEDFLRIVVPLALTFIVVFNYRTEKYTLVVLTPVFAFMIHAALSERMNGNSGLMKCHFAALAAGWFLVSMAYSDLVPPFVRHFAGDVHLKGLGGLFMYGWAWVHALHYLYFRLPFAAQKPELESG